VLYDPAAVEPLTEEPFDEARVRAGIARIVAGTDEAFDPETLWPAHPDDAYLADLPLTDLYAGAAGIVLALDALRRRGLAETALDLAAICARALELWPDLVDGPELPLPAQAASSLFTGETGILLVSWRLAPSADLADVLLVRVRENVANEADELMWGTPGTLLAARAMHGWTGEERWAEAARESSEALLARREDGIWTQRLFGQVRQYLGPAHGFAGVVQSLLPGDALEREAADVLRREAVIEDGLANWPSHVGGELAQRRGPIHVQWCHGAPGIVTSASTYLDEDLLLAGAELTWRAGALEKGPSLCHGTAGNGHALLKGFERTGDEAWLERARRFAVHALALAERGPRRHSLFSGDLGAALFAASCLDGDARFPVLERWD
jgi:lantibiotic modifying enzyme